MPSPSLKFALSLAIAGAVLLAVGGCDRKTGGGAQPSQAGAGTESPGLRFDRSHRGARAPSLTFKDPSGKELQLAELAGKPFLLNLWATWCAPCVAELPKLDALAAKTERLRVVTVSEDLGDPAKVAQFLKDKGLTRLEPWLDPDNAATVQYGVASLPSTIYYDAEGRELWRITGGHDWTSPETAAMLDE